MSMRLWIAGGALVLAGGSIFLISTERPPVGGVQRGYRGTAAFYIYNPRVMDETRAANRIPATLPPSGDVGPVARTIYKNVQVLGNVHAGEFTRLMVSMTNWVAPKQGCSACHNTANFSDDSLYTKRVARRMLQMVLHVNTDWKQHVANTGVTCYTCHRGQLVPPNVWFNNPGPAQAGGLAQAPIGKNHPNAAAAGSALPLDPYTVFLEQANDIKVQSTTALPTDSTHTMKQAEWTYSLMLSISKALGVNCDYCHFTRSFADWSQSTPQRVTAWYGIRMVRDLNTHFLDPLQGTFPPWRLGTAFGDSPKVNCATCHNGVFKPLFGVSMAKGFPELGGVWAQQ
jgi:photosynthetic reaction center cytochrome c subunit